jgi:phytoene desaturase
MSDPSLLITTPTVSDPSLAPPGRELHYVLAPCPNLRTGPHNWRAIAPHYRDSLLTTLRDRGLGDLGGLGGPDGLDGLDSPDNPGGPGGLGDRGDGPAMERLVTPADWAAQQHPAGTPFSAAHTFTQTGPFRTRNLPSGWENVVLAGCGTTPGVGVPTVIVSGKLAAARVTGVHHRTPHSARRPADPGAPAGAPAGARPAKVAGPDSARGRGPAATAPER